MCYVVEICPEIFVDARKISAIRQLDGNREDTIQIYFDSGSIMDVYCDTKDSLKMMHENCRYALT